MNANSPEGDNPDNEVESEEVELIQVRLNKFLADHGVASRRACDELISEGRVRINGRVVTDLGVKVDPASDEVYVDEEKLEAENKVYFLLYKPKGVICTNGISHGRPRAIDLLKPRVRERIYCVGRLDEDSEGLILVTNDGAFSQRVAHPRHEVPKTYHLKVQGNIAGLAIEKAMHGIHLAEGRTSGAKIKVLRRSETGSSLLVTLREGRNREIRRVFARLGHPVKSLIRVRIGNLTTTGLRSGAYRALRKGEIQELLSSAIPEDEVLRGPRKRKVSKYAQERKRLASAGKRRASADGEEPKKRRSQSGGAPKAQTKRTPSAKPSGKPSAKPLGKATTRPTTKPTSKPGTAGKPGNASKPGTGGKLGNSARKPTGSKKASRRPPRRD